MNRCVWRREWDDGESRGCMRMVRDAFCGERGVGKGERARGKP